MTCPLCDDQFIIVTGGPDAFGNYDTEDCPCQLGYSPEEVERMVERDEP